MNDDALLALCARAQEAHAGIGTPIVEYGEVSIDVPAAAIVEVAEWFRAQGPFEQLADLSAIDWHTYEPPERRFLVSVQLASISHPGRLRLRVWLPEDDLRMPSLTGSWSGADWLERETYDFFGITFEGHPNLTRIFMPDDWVGHPQRKDYPLGGIDVSYEHGQAVTPPDDRARRATTTSGYPGRTA